MANTGGVDIRCEYLTVLTLEGCMSWHVAPTVCSHADLDLCQVSNGRNESNQFSCDRKAIRAIFEVVPFQ